MAFSMIGQKVIIHYNNIDQDAHILDKIQQIHLGANLTVDGYLVLCENRIFTIDCSSVRRILFGERLN